MKKILTLLIFTALVSQYSYAVNYDEIYGKWEISPIKDGNRSIFFAGEFGSNIVVEFRTDNTLKVQNNKEYYFQLNGQRLIVGKFIKNGVVKGGYDTYQIGAKVAPNLSYGQTCYEFETIKLGMGGYKAKDSMKICREKRSILDRTY